MANIDELLEGLRGMDADPRLATMDTAVMAGVAAHREKSTARRGLVLTSVLALGVGLVTSALAPQGARAEQSVSLNAVPLTAPSSLLMGAR
ncbi:MAG TPA: hypothetical protein VF503_01020 [Sphingobium sp.]|uniref:hypothetical protein n=1 Tax=Sphingobium sp. TaxID=1912891 RepID=UPI002ED2D024